MTKMEIKENKKLVLKHVLIKNFKNIALEKVDQEITKFMNELKMLKAQTFGPLVTRASGSHFHEDGSITMDYQIMMQAHDYKQYKNKYTAKERVEYPHSVYLRFKGKPENMQFAHSKLDVYFYEEELISDGSIVNVFVGETEEEITIDFLSRWSGYEAL